MNDDTPQHGGNLQQAAQRYGIPRSDWLDLSTGIAPFSWPVPAVPADVWQRLPEADGELEQAAKCYYGVSGLPVPGSQWAIQQLPALFPESRALIAQESYEEYRLWWRRHGHEVATFSALPEAAQLRERDIVIVINPNNPTAQLHTPQHLLQLADDLQRKNGWLIVDEAFMDATPEDSLLSAMQAERNIIVLRSLGKFFGLAGIRTGFVLGNAHIQSALQKKLGPWAISHPAQWIATQALSDFPWHAVQRQRLQQISARLRTLLAQHFPADTLTATPLFVCVKLCDDTTTRHWQESLARQGIWIRRFPQWNRLRFGVMAESSLPRLALALHHANPAHRL